MKSIFSFKNLFVLFISVVALGTFFVVSHADATPLRLSASSATFDIYNKGPQWVTLTPPTGSDLTNYLIYNTVLHRRCNGYGYGYYSATTSAGEDWCQSAFGYADGRMYGLSVRDQDGNGVPVEWVWNGSAATSYYTFPVANGTTVRIKGNPDYKKYTSSFSVELIGNIPSDINRVYYVTPVTRKAQFTWNNSSTMLSYGSEQDWTGAGTFQINVKNRLYTNPGFVCVQNNVGSFEVTAFYNGVTGVSNLLSVTSTFPTSTISGYDKFNIVPAGGSTMQTRLKFYVKPGTTGSGTIYVGYINDTVATIDLQVGNAPCGHFGIGGNDSLSLYAGEQASAPYTVIPSIGTTFNWSYVSWVGEPIPGVSVLSPVATRVFVGSGYPGCGGEGGIQEVSVNSHKPKNIVLGFLYDLFSGLTKKAYAYYQCWAYYYPTGPNVTLKIAANDTNMAVVKTGTLRLHAYDNTGAIADKDVLITVYPKLGMSVSPTSVALDKNQTKTSSITKVVGGHSNVTYSAPSLSTSLYSKGVNASYDNPLDPTNVQIVTSNTAQNASGTVTVQVQGTRIYGGTLDTVTKDIAVEIAIPTTTPTTTTSTPIKLQLYPGYVSHALYQLPSVDTILVRTKNRPASLSCSQITALPSVVSLPNGSFVNLSGPWNLNQTLQECEKVATVNLYTTFGVRSLNQELRVTYPVSSGVVGVATTTLNILVSPNPARVALVPSSGWIYPSPATTTTSTAYTIFAKDFDPEINFTPQEILSGITGPLGVAKNISSVTCPASVPSGMEGSQCFKVYFTSSPINLTTQVTRSFTVKVVREGYATSTVGTLTFVPPTVSTFVLNALEPQSNTVVKPGSVQYLITAQRVGGFSSPITLSLTGLTGISDVTAAFTNPTVGGLTGNGSLNTPVSGNPTITSGQTQKVLTLTAGQNATVRDNIPFSIVGTSGTLVSTSTGLLSIKSQAPTSTTSTPSCLLTASPSYGYAPLSVNLSLSASGGIPPYSMKIRPTAQAAYVAGSSLTYEYNSSAVAQGSVTDAANVTATCQKSITVTDINSTSSQMLLVTFEKPTQQYVRVPRVNYTAPYKVTVKDKDTGVTITDPILMVTNLPTGVSANVEIIGGVQYVKLRILSSAANGTYTFKVTAKNQDGSKSGEATGTLILKQYSSTGGGEINPGNF